MSKTRMKHSAEFKAKVALEAMSSLHTLEEVASKYAIHPLMVSKWKKQLQENATGAFERDSKRTKEENERKIKIEQLYQTIGQREYELDWLKKKLGVNS